MRVPCDFACATGAAELARRSRDAAALARRSKDAAAAAAAATSTSCGGSGNTTSSKKQQQRGEAAVAAAAAKGTLRPAGRGSSSGGGSGVGVDSSGSGRAGGSGGIGSKAKQVVGGMKRSASGALADMAAAAARGAAAVPGGAGLSRSLAAVAAAVTGLEEGDAAAEAELSVVGDYDGQKADVYSLGVLLVVLVLRRMPWNYDYVAERWAGVGFWERGRSKARRHHNSVPFDPGLKQQVAFVAQFFLLLK